jgi:hypothetical protein
MTARWLDAPEIIGIIRNPAAEPNVREQVF